MVGHRSGNRADGARAAKRQLGIAMPRAGAIVFRDIVGKLEVIRVECDKCGPVRSYRVDRLINDTLSIRSFSTGWTRSLPTARADGLGI